MINNSGSSEPSEFLKLKNMYVQYKNEIYTLIEDFKTSYKLHPRYIKLSAIVLQLETVYPELMGRFDVNSVLRNHYGFN